MKFKSKLSKKQIQSIFFLVIGLVLLIYKFENTLVFIRYIGILLIAISVLDLYDESIKRYKIINPFNSNKFDSKGNAYSQFEEFCKQNKIKHILCRIKHPQSNGKIERWFGLYKQKGKFFLTLKEFVYWYNHVKPHLSLNFEELETPAQAFERKFKK